MQFSPPLQAKISGTEHAFDSILQLCWLALKREHV
jgi:hypothetical protein